MKIAFVGTQCVGKSTFIEDVCKAFPEFSRPTWTYRDAIKEAGIENEINQKTCIASQKLIFDAVCEEARRAPENSLLDRSVMDAVAYTIWPGLYGDNETDITPQAIKNMRNTATEMMSFYDLVVYIPIDESIALEDDNFRDTDPEYRRQMAKIFKDYLFKTLMILILINMDTRSQPSQAHVKNVSTNSKNILKHTNNRKNTNGNNYLCCN